MKRRAFTLLIAAASTVATALVILVGLNLSLGDRLVDVPFVHRQVVADASFRRTLDSVLTPALVAGNQVDELLNGEQIFPAMLAAVRSARSTITVETYIYWSGTIAREFSDVLRERARSGVRVHVLLDWIGGELDDELLETMRADGVEIRRYNPPAWTRLGRFNNRTHRRLLVVDGRTGFIGGAGLADAWRGSGERPGHWRDTHFRVGGPVVAQLQSAFIDNWLQTTGRVLHGDAYLPPLQSTGSSEAQVFTASPRGGSRNMQVMFMLALTAATRSIDLSASYFIPDEVAIATLVDALKRGVRVRIIVPGPYIDKAIARHASRATWGPLLEAGAEIHEYQPTMFHCKVTVVDGRLTSVGSTNFDTRSFTINDEANMNVLDADFAARQTAVFEDDLKRTKRIGLEEWRQRPWRTKALDALASLAASQL